MAYTKNFNRYIILTALAIYLPCTAPSKITVPPIFENFQNKTIYATYI
jgi:hypothetical protein